MFYQVKPIDICTHIPGTVAQSSSSSEYNVECTAGMVLENFRRLNIELLNKDPDVVLEQASLIVLDRKSYICMSKNGKYTKHTRHITRIMNLVRDGEE